jgi:4-diphosphocytidyl-2-C-methyl-D-erythritol kinase
MLIARAPAKVNLALRVVGRREDGYHELDTVFQAIDLWDRLELVPAPRLELSCDDPGIPTDRENLAFRAAELLRARHRAPAIPGAAIRLRKEIPAQAGLGGGSADAAAALLLFNRYWDLRLPRDELARLGGELGADVPFFLYGSTARGRGRGDLVQPLAWAGPSSILLGIPPFGISTAEVFARLASRLTVPENGVNLHVPSAHKLPVEKDFWLAANDLEGVVFRDWPELRRFRDALLATGADRALLSGSGSAVFGVFADEAATGEAARGLRARFARWRLIPTRAVDAAAHLVHAGGEGVRPG